MSPFKECATCGQQVADGYTHNCKPKKSETPARVVYTKRLHELKLIAITVGADGIAVAEFYEIRTQFKFQMRVGASYNPINRLFVDDPTPELHRTLLASGYTALPADADLTPDASL